MFLLFAYGELIFYLILMVFVMNFLEIFLTFFILSLLLLINATPGHFWHFILFGV
jgi:hypothetical protein